MTKFWVLLCATALPLFAGNELTDSEQATGWRLLFDGKSLAGWRPYGKPGAGPEAITNGWKVADGVLLKVGGEKGGDIITDRTFDNFELAWEWRISKGGNNGVKYMVTEARPGAPGYEYQMVDDLSERWQKAEAVNRTAAFYDILAPAADKLLKPAGEWNASRVVVNGSRVEHWLNGAMVLAYELGGDAVKAGLATSHFKKHPDFGTKIVGHIMLTDHRDEASFRNIKLRELPAK